MFNIYLVDYVVSLLYELHGYSIVSIYYLNG